LRFGAARLIVIGLLAIIAMQVDSMLAVFGTLGLATVVPIGNAALVVGYLLAARRFPIETIALLRVKS
jgi:hypothetical protein